jgi:hypothetical protein
LALKLRKNLALSESGFLFDPATGDSFLVNATGQKILEFLKSGFSRTEIVDALNENFEAEKK